MMDWIFLNTITAHSSGDEVMAWHPGEFYHPLPFSGEQVREIKSVGDNFILYRKGNV